MNDRQVRMLVRFVAGGLPRCSAADFEAISKAVPGVFQRESANGADTRAGYVLCALKSDEQSTKAVSRWLEGRGASVPASGGGGAVARSKRPGGRALRGPGAAAIAGASACSDTSPKSDQQIALERSELWKLYLAIKSGADQTTLMTLAREANAEFISNLTPNVVAG
ncbi:hypothetical protein [Ottowia sp.]|uniref:hypothetical protein n=1 Tax=Ottowia sp. TaxID=1898956 RepID=UPI0025D203E2|nr:hypothetical protein [Ottowia sp.]MBK6616297.1 hypothetical protein [Ottowia sp.]